MSHDAFTPWLTDSMPNRVIIAGDWHGNELWSSHVIQQAASVLSAEQRKIIIHLGDFGVWPTHPWYVNRIGRELDDNNIIVVFVDGNHEWHDRLDELHVEAPGPVPVDKSRRVWHLPRGTRWKWHGKKWLAVGGAGSPDVRQRVPGQSWWSQEIITHTQADQIITGGPADVLVSHDCPMDWYPVLPPPPPWWDLVNCHASSRELQRVADAVQPTYVMHGHLHRNRYDEFSLPDERTVHVTGLDADGTNGNWAILNVKSMMWEDPVST